MANISNFSSNNPNPYTGVFGIGKFQAFPVTGTFTVPTGITSVRVRCWGAGGNSAGNGYGGYNGGGGGGFTMRTITGLTPSANVSVTVGSPGSGTHE